MYASHYKFGSCIYYIYSNLTCILLTSVMKQNKKKWASVTLIYYHKLYGIHAKYCNTIIVTVCVCVVFVLFVFLAGGGGQFCVA